MAGAVGGGVTTFSASALEKLTNSEYDQSWGEILINTAVDTGVGAALSFVDVPLERVTSGRNSHMAVYKGGLTRIRNGNARRMSVGVMKKGLFAFSVSSLPMDAYYGVKQYAYPLLMDASEEIQYPIGPAYFEAH